MCVVVTLSYKYGWIYYKLDCHIHYFLSKKCVPEEQTKYNMLGHIILKAFLEYASVIYDSFFIYSTFLDAKTDVVIAFY